MVPSCANDEASGLGILLFALLDSGVLMIEPVILCL